MGDVSRIRTARRPRPLVVSVRPAVPANDAAPPPSDPEVLLVEELAVLLRMHVKSVYEHLAAGLIPGAKKVGASPGAPSGVWRIHRPTVVAWLSGQIGAPGPRKRGRG